MQVMAHTLAIAGIQWMQDVTAHNWKKWKNDILLLTAYLKFES